jgi:hypothetical protein
MKIEIPKDRNAPVRIIKEKGDEGYKKPEGGYWVRIPEKWWRVALHGLKPIERCILISLRVAGAWKPNKSHLARELDTTRHTIIKYLKILKKKGLL